MRTLLDQEPPTPPSPPPKSNKLNERDPPPNEEERTQDAFENRPASRSGSDELEQDHFPSPPPDDLPPENSDPVVLDDFIESLRFIEMVEDATLESQLSPEELGELRNPRSHSSTPSDDPDLLLSISCFIDLLNSSQGAYEKICKNVQKRDPTIEMLSYDRVKRTVHDLSGILTWEDDMCINSCIAFTGPFADLESCLRCEEPRYDPDKLEKSGGKTKVPRKRFTTFPVGPQIQAHWKHPETAKKMFYQHISEPRSCLFDLNK